MTYEKAMAELEKIVQTLENEEVSMDEVLEKVKRAKFLMEFCKNKLRSIEAEVQEVLAP